MKFKLSIFLLILIFKIGFAVDNPNYKLLVDDGRYEESTWVKQMAISSDDKYLIISDFSSGVRLFDLETGKLVNVFEGHSLEGDMFYNKQNNTLVTTGDCKIKIWDLTNQKLIKQITQGFHSQFMNNVYIDSKKKVVFAENIKYDVNTKAVLKKYEQGMFFYQDKYYVFGGERGTTISEFSVYDDRLIRKFDLDNSVSGSYVNYNQYKGEVYISNSEGIHCVDITTGKTIFIDYASTGDFSWGAVFDFNFDKSIFMVASEKPAFITQENSKNFKFKLYKKNNISGKFAETYSNKLSVGELLTLNNSNRLVLSYDGIFGLFDLETQQFIWQKKYETAKPKSLKLSLDSTRLNINFGQRDIHYLTVEGILGRDKEVIAKYFNKSGEYYYSFKSALSKDQIPEALYALWDDRRQSKEMALNHGFKFKEIRDMNEYLCKGSEDMNESYLTGKIYSPSKRYYAEILSNEGVVIYKDNIKIFTSPPNGVLYHLEFSSNERYVAFGGAERIVTVIDLVQKQKLHSFWGDSYITSICFSNDNKYLFTGSLKNEILMFDLVTKARIRTFTGSNGKINDLEISYNNKILMSIADDKALRCWETNTGKLLLTTYFDYNLNYISFTPDGYFDKSEKFNGLISFNFNGNVIELEQLFNTYYRPDLIRNILNGKNNQQQIKKSVSNGVSYPPEVAVFIDKSGETRGAEIISEDSIVTGNITVKVTAKNKGGGVKGIRLYVNNKIVAEKFMTETNLADTTNITASFNVSLLEGINQIYATGYSKDMTESRGKTIQYVYKPSKTLRPRLFVMAIGINKYKNPKYNLNYCVEDMQAFSDNLKIVGNKLFEEVILTTLEDNLATKANITKLFHDYAAKANPSDVFVFFYAGHGIALEKGNSNGEMASEFYYVLNGVTQMTDTEKCSGEGLSGSEMRELLAGIKANKQVLFIDACNSGAFAEQFKIRGAAEENALAKLSKSTGSVVFASTTKEQYATEFDQLKHGVFTYVLLEALSGEASLANCQITTSSIRTYVDDKIPAYSEKYKGQAQYPTTFMFGQDFPLGLKCKGR